MLDGPSVEAAPDARKAGLALHTAALRIAARHYDMAIGPADFSVSAKSAYQNTGDIRGRTNARRSIGGRASCFNVSIAPWWNIGLLDFKLSLVEQMLAEAHQYVGELGATEIDGLVGSLGNYLLESVRRAKGGTYKWFADKRQPVLIVGEPDFHVALATWDKVRGRLMSDVGDNIPFHMSGFLDCAHQARPGDRVREDGPAKWRTVPHPADSCAA